VLINLLLLNLQNEKEKEKNNKKNLKKNNNYKLVFVRHIQKSSQQTIREDKNI